MYSLILALLKPNLKMLRDGQISKMGHVNTFEDKTDTKNRHKNTRKLKPTQKQVAKRDNPALSNGSGTLREGARQDLAQFYKDSPKFLVP